MRQDQELKRLSDLVRLCGSTMRIIAKQRARDGAGGAALELALDLDRIAHKINQLNNHPDVESKGISGVEDDSSTRN